MTKLSNQEHLDAPTTPAEQSGDSGSLGGAETGADGRDHRVSTAHRYARSREVAGLSIDPPADLVKALRNKGVEGRDRDAVLEFAAMIQGRPPAKTLADIRASRVESEPDPRASTTFQMMWPGRFRMVNRYPTVT